MHLIAADPTIWFNDLVFCFRALRQVSDHALASAAPNGAVKLTVCEKLSHAKYVFSLLGTNYNVEELLTPRGSRHIALCGGVSVY